MYARAWTRPIASLVGLVAFTACGEGTSDDDDANYTESAISAAQVTLQSLGKCLDIPGNRQTAGARLQLWRCNGGSAQKWRFSGNAIISTSGLCVDIPYDNEVPGAPVALWPCNNSNAQIWRRAGDTLVSTRGLCLDVNRASNADGTAVQLWNCNGGQNQKWTSVTSSSPPPTPPTTPTAPTPTNPTPSPPSPSSWKGINLAGAEYGPGATGVYGTQYIYPSNSEFDYYASKKMTIVRLPFDIARLQPGTRQPLRASELEHITSAVDYANKKGMRIILDPHNYGRMWSSATSSYQLIGTSGYVSNDDFADFWERLATVYKDRPNVVYGLMNEPNVQNPSQWRDSAIAAVKAIRKVSTTQTILIPGTYYTTAATWTTSGNSAAWTGYRDPAGGPFMFEMHQYLDSNYSGTSGNCVTGYGSSVLTKTTEWLATNGYQAFLGEFDWFDNAGCKTEGTALLQAMQNSPKQWAGWAWWGSGPWAWNNGVNLDPGANGTPGDQPQMSTLLKFIP